MTRNITSLDCKPLCFSSAEVYSDCGLSVLCYSVVSQKLLALGVENENVIAPHRFGGLYQTK